MNIRIILDTHLSAQNLVVPILSIVNPPTGKTGKSPTLGMHRAAGLMRVKDAGQATAMMRVPVRTMLYYNVREGNPLVHPSPPHSVFIPLPASHACTGCTPLYSEPSHPFVLDIHN